MAKRLGGMGFEVCWEPKAGMFLRVRHPALPDASEMCNKVAECDILLGPGHLFDPALKPTAWMRFHVVFCEDERVFDFVPGECGREAP